MRLKRSPARLATKATRWVLALGLLLVAPLALSTLGLGGNGSVGSLPSADDGDGSQNFYMRAPRDLVDEAVVDAWGEGFYVAVSLPDNEMWLEFYGNVTVRFDRTVLEAHTDSIQLGISPGFNGGGMLVLPEIDGQFAPRPIQLEAGFPMGTPYEALEPLLDAPLSLHTTQALTGVRGELAYTGIGSLLEIVQSIR